MSPGKLFALSLAGLSLFVSSQAVQPVSAQDAPETVRKPVRIGMVQTLFTDVPTPLVRIILQPFGALMKDFTGLEGSMLLGGDALSLGKELEEGKIDVGIFHGVEYAWARQKYPKLRPLVFAITKYKHAQAHLVVRKDMETAPIADLKGKVASLPLRSREHCRLFLDRAARDAGAGSAKDYFGKVVASANPETALDDLCLGKVDIAVVDTVALDVYQDIKPGVHARLKVWKSSEQFPTGCIAYREGSLDEEVISKFRIGLSEGNKTERGREMMGLFRITAFESEMEGYEQNLADIIKIYPSPEAVLPVSTQR